MSGGMSIDAVLLFLIFAVLSGAVVSFWQGLKTLGQMARYQGERYLALQALGLSLCEPLLNMAAIFGLFLTAGLSEVFQVDLVPRLLPLAALVLPAWHLLRSTSYQPLYIGLLLQGLVRWAIVTAILSLSGETGGWIVLWSGAIWYAALWGAQQRNWLLRLPNRS